MGSSASHPNKEINVLEKVLHPEVARKKVRPGRESDCDDYRRTNYGRHGKFLLPESLDPNDYNSVVKESDKQLTTGPPNKFTNLPSGVQHHSTIRYLVDFRPDEYSHSTYDEINVWRCADRLSDFTASALSIRMLPAVNFAKCMLSRPGEEPDAPYRTLGRHSAEFYAERRQVGQMRDNLFASGLKVVKDPFPVTGPVLRDIDPVD
eukprot:TRINITY_DN28026_c0_g1_i1.p1 TRINITY_DN28026_c0_g1~~TRINITY_DN28026_c0_g1_i1.p1  ORF type:complete len:231 (+),score=20.91 TRINITY_DN28026_c0_g1_i1:77-694(+)